MSRSPVKPSRIETSRRPAPAALLASLGLACALAGCAVGPEYRQPRTDLPAAWTPAAADTTTAAATVAVQADWWRGFDDPLLAQLVQRALAANTDVRIARARLRAARAATAQAEASLWPSVGGYGSASRSSVGGQDATSSYGVGFDASWEIDLFGGLRRGVEAADADAQASAATLGATQVSLAAEVARDYVQLRSYQLRTSITQANLDSQTQTLQLTQWRAQAGLVGQLDVEQARSNREQTSAQLPLLRDAATQSANALAVLLNVAPGTLAAELGAEAPAIPAGAGQPLAGIPADLLRRRPDIVAAERNLAAATARIGVAEAARYPSLSLSGTLGLQGALLSALSGNAAANRFGLASLTAPIFDAGKLRQQVVIRSAEQEQALAAYEAALYGALRDVENARASLANGRARSAALAQAVQAARNAALLANFRYRSGLCGARGRPLVSTRRAATGCETHSAPNRADSRCPCGPSDRCPPEHREGIERRWPHRVHSVHLQIPRR